MNLRNNIYVEVMHAHFNHYLTYYRHEPLNSSKEHPQPPIHGYPDDFFKIFELLVNPTDEKQKAVNEELEKLLEDNADQFPELDNTAKPQVKYNSIMGIRLNFKQIKVGHPDARVTTVTYRYRFYKLHYVFLFLFTRDKMRRAHIYNNHLKNVQREVYPEILPLAKARQHNPPIKVNEPLDEEQMEISEDWTFEFTMRRRCIAIIHLLNVTGVDFSRTDLTQVAKLIHLLTDKEIPVDGSGIPKISNSPIYKMVKNLYSISRGKIKNDLLMVKNMFEQFTTKQGDTPMQELINQLNQRLQDAKNKGDGVG